MSILQNSTTISKRPDPDFWEIGALSEQNYCNGCFLEQNNVATCVYVATTTTAYYRRFPLGILQGDFYN